MLDLRRLRKEVASILRDYYIIKCNCLLIYHLLFWLRRKRRKNELFQKSKKSENLKFLRFLLSIYFPVFPSFPSGVFQRPCLVGCRRILSLRTKRPPSPVIFHRINNPRCTRPRGGKWSAGTYLTKRQRSLEN